MKALHVIAFILLVIGGLNWGLTAFGINVVEMVLGSWPVVVQVVYVLVGLSAIYILLTHKRGCTACGCETKSMSASAPVDAPMQ